MYLEIVTWLLSTLVKLQMLQMLFVKMFMTKPYLGSPRNTANLYGTYNLCLG